jgi:hypothetical protein
MEDQAARILAIINKVYPLKLFTDAQREAIAIRAPVDSIEEEKPLYVIDQEAVNLYVIISGRVRLTWPVDEEDPELGELNLGELEPGDVLGLEALEDEAKYKTGAVTLTPVQVMRLNMEFLDPFFEENTLPYTPLKVMLKSHKLFLHTDLPWRNPEEAIIYLARRDLAFLVYRLIAPVTLFLIGIIALLVLMILNPPGTILPGIIVGVVALAAGLWSIWNYVDWTNDYAILTNQRAVFQERVVALYDSRDETPLDAILSTSIVTSNIGRILGYGNVIMKTYTGTLIFPNLTHWEAVRSLIDDRRTRAREISLQAEKQSLRSTIRQRLRITPPPPPKPVHQAKAEEHHVSLGEFLANLFRMRTDKNGVITYRTHWFILMRKTFLPFIILVGLALLAFLRLAGVVVIFTSLAFWAIFAIAVLTAGTWLWYQYEDWSNDQYIVTDEQITDINKKPLGREEKRIAPLKSIQGIDFERLGLLGLVLNYGTVFIRIGDTRFTFDDVYNPSEVQRDLFRRIATQADKERRKTIDSERQQILDVLEAYHEVTHQSPTGNPPPPAEQPSQPSPKT